MDSLQTLKTAFQRIPPVGDPISLRQGPVTHPLLETARAQTYQSGTAALAAALLVAKQLAEKRLADKQQLSCSEQHAASVPEVILPAYACPDLISAVVYAQCRPVLVDIEHGLPYMRLPDLQSSLNANTVAVIAPWFLGVPERFAEIRALLTASNALLIEDSAQWFPESDPTEAYQGDLVVLSFGKGKPVSLLGGGLLYDRRADLRALFPIPAPAAAVPSSLPALLAKFAAYNLVIHRLFYWLIELAPFIEMGKTVYKKLESLQEIPALKLSFIQANIDAYLQRTRRAENGLKQLLSDVGFPHSALSNRAPTYQQQRMLRFPILVDVPAQRNSLLDSLQRAGLGASTFYPAPLNEIDNIPDIVKSQGPFPNAKDFASRLITLPTHRGCNTGFLLRIRGEFSPRKRIAQ